MHHLKTAFMSAALLLTISGTANALDPGPGNDLPPVPTYTYQFSDTFFNPLTGMTVEMPPVTITGHRCSTDSVCLSLYNQLTALGDSGMNQFLNSVSHPIVNTPNKSKIPTKIDLPLDVRSNCAIPGKQDLARTTSQSPWDMRQDAVKTVVGANTAYWAAQMVKGRLANTLVSVGGQFFMAKTFTYADGGTEDYLINPLVTDQAQQQPNTLKQGDGEAKDVPC